MISEAQAPPSFDVQDLLAYTDAHQIHYFIPSGKAAVYALLKKLYSMDFLSSLGYLQLAVLFFQQISEWTKPYECDGSHSWSMKSLSIQSPRSAADPYVAFVSDSYP